MAQSRQSLYGAVLFALVISAIRGEVQHVGCGGQFRARLSQHREVGCAGRVTCVFRAACLSVREELPP